MPLSVSMLCQKHRGPNVGTHWITTESQGAGVSLATICPEVSLTVGQGRHGFFYSNLNYPNWYQITNYTSYSQFFSIFITKGLQRRLGTESEREVERPLTPSIRNKACVVEGDCGWDHHCSCPLRGRLWGQSWSPGVWGTGHWRCRNERQNWVQSDEPGVRWTLSQADHMTRRDWDRPKALGQLSTLWYWSSDTHTGWSGFTDW